MQFAKRIFLFLLTNFLVMMTISILLKVFGFHGYLTAYGIDYQQLMIFCLVWGMGGALFSLAISRWMAKRAMGVQVIDPRRAGGWQADLVERVHRLARGAGLTVMPEVGVYDSPELNAFATGPTKNRSLVAVSTGLLDRMGPDELDGVIGHEISHVANGDMVTLTLLQGVVNAFVMFLARVVAFAIAQAMRDRDERGSGPSYFLQWVIQFALEIVFMILGSMVVAAFSRWREYRADSGGARLAGRGSMVAALRKLQATYEIVDPEMDNSSVETMKISGHRRGRLSLLFASHPPLSARISRLENATA
ncbi:MAG: protease HtpX [Bdellovibrionales bacterium]|nr:protease HtpX [Bdellovibrionales bacterium]